MSAAQRHRCTTPTCLRHGGCAACYPKPFIWNPNKPTSLAARAGGLFMPSIMVGSSFGAACGLGLMGALPSWNIQPGLYAMCAAAAMLGGVFRASISLVVIVVEGTQVCCCYLCC